MLPLKKIIIITNVAALIAFGILIMSGCGKEEPQYVEVQEVKDTPAKSAGTMSSAMDAASHDHSNLFTYELPSSWSAKEHSSMILMAFQAGNPPQLMADVQISAFPGDVGGQLANINRWRRQVGLGPVAPEAVKDFITEMEISGMPAWQVSFTGPASASTTGEPVCMVVSAVSYDEKTWFFKLTGSESAVKDEKANYDAFLSSVKF